MTTIRVVGSQGLLPQQARQAMRYGAFRGPRLLTCAKIVSATAPGGRFYGDMYREADGQDDMRRAVREQIRAGAEGRDPRSSKNCPVGHCTRSGMSAFSGAFTGLTQAAAVTMCRWRALSAN